MHFASIRKMSVCCSLFYRSVVPNSIRVCRPADVLRGGISYIGKVVPSSIRVCRRHLPRPDVPEARLAAFRKEHHAQTVRPAGIDPAAERLPVVSVKLYHRAVHKDAKTQRLARQQRKRGALFDRAARDAAARGIEDQFLALRIVV